MYHIIRFLKYFDQHEYTLLIGSLFLLLVLYPFTIERSVSSVRVHGCISLVLITGMYAASTFKKFLTVSLFIWWLSFLFLRIEFLTKSETIYLLYIISWLTLFSFITFNLIRNLIKEERVNTELILGAIAGYLMIGLLSAFIYAFINFFIPESITGITTSWLESFPQLIYFSYVNMTTVGYGDMIPITAHAQSRSVISTISWQMYLTILIWVIVGKYIRRWSHKNHH
jgi:hypothetical protein